LKLRTTFTLWIALSSFLAAFLASIFVYIEMQEEPLKLIKRELADTGNSILKNTHPGTTEPFRQTTTDYPVERYYIKLYGPSNKVLYRSSLAAKIDIPKTTREGFYAIERRIAPKQIWLDPLDDDDYDKQFIRGQVKFTVLQMAKEVNGVPLTLVIAKPLATMSFELNELLHELIISIVALTVLFVLISYFLAGWLLKPISKINQKITSIRERSLNERIPLGKSQDEIYALSVSLNSMFDRLQFSFQRQKDFLSSASHEMKIPLTIIMLGHEEMLSRDLSDDLKIDLHKQLDNLRRLNRLVKDLLDISHLEHKEFIEHAVVELPSLIERILEDFDEMIQASGITCATRIERLKVLGDFEKLTRVFINLINNAIKYNLPSKGLITIAVCKKGSLAEIVIINTGEEIPEEDLPHIFTQFYRVEKSRSAQYGGTGLGLTIVKKIIELHGGTIKAESGDGKTQFTISLPLAGE
jgi:two-component system OmpR family sensor kinase